MSDPVSQTTLKAPRGRAWLLFADLTHAQQMQAELDGEGWQVELCLANMQQLLLHLHCEPAPPDLLVCGLVFEDGDAFRLMRLLAGDARAPALLFSTRRQRSVLKSALSMAAACKLDVAGHVEHPAPAGQLAAALQACRHRVPVPATDAVLELSAEALREMLGQNRLQAWMQPQLRLSSGEVVCVEALMRGVGENGALVMPDRLLPGLKRHGLLDAATLAMVRQTCGFLAGCLEDGLLLNGSINASLHSLADQGFCEQLAQAVRDSGVDPGRITLEITENEAAADLATVIENTSRIRLMGFNVSIDDFGTAYCSLLQLSQLAVSELKIDRTFVAALTSDATKRLIVSSCATLARGLGLRVVAEGVETPQELAVVREAGCTEVQGYLLARPMAMDSMRQWLRGLDNLRLPLAVPAGAPG